jgi:hypothetical protein
MTHALYQIDSRFKAVRSALSEGVDQTVFDDLSRHQLLHVVVYCAEREDRFNPVAAAREFAAFLDLNPNRIDPFFTRPSRTEAETICVSAAEFAVFYGGMLPHAQAAALAAAWMAEFDDSATFFSNVDPIASPTTFSSFYGGLFYRDVDVGVLAVSPTKAGLFWSAENS